MNTIILVVDQNQNDLNTSASILEKNEYTTKKASCCKSAMSILDQEPISIFVIDLSSNSGTNHLELIQHIRANQKFANTPIIITSSHSKPGELRKAVELGVNGYIVKSADEDVYAEKFMNLLSKLDH